MNELFSNIPDISKNIMKQVVDSALFSSNPYSAIKIINNYIKAHSSEEEKNFIDFYFKLRMEQLKNESNSN